MRKLTLIALFALVVAACSGTSSSSTTATSASTLPGEDVEVPVEIDLPPQLEGFAVESVPVGDREMLLAIADDPTLRAQGLMGVTDLGDLDGMLFFWRHDGSPMWMKDTVIPLDVAWFNEDGTFKHRAAMTPCTVEPCPTYAPADLDFRFAIEAPLGDLDWIDESTVIVYSD